MNYKECYDNSIDTGQEIPCKMHMGSKSFSKKLKEIEYNQDEMLSYIDSSIKRNDDEYKLSDEIDLEEMISFLVYFTEYYSDNYDILPKNFLEQSNIYVLLNCLLAYPSFDLHHTVFEILAQLSNFIVPSIPDLIGAIYGKMYEIFYQLYNEEEEIIYAINQSQITESYESKDELKRKVIQDFFYTVSNWMIDISTLPNYINEGQIIFLEDVTLNLEEESCAMALKFFQNFLYYAKNDEKIQSKMDNNGVGELVVFCMNKLKVFDPNICLFISGLLSQIADFDEFAIYLIDNGIESKILDVLARHHIEISVAVYKLSLSIIRHRNSKEQHCRFASSNRFYEIIKFDLTNFEGDIIILICSVLRECMEYWELIHEYVINILLKMLHEGTYKSRSSALTIIISYLEIVPFELRKELLDERTFDSLSESYEDEKLGTAEFVSEVMLKVLKYEDPNNEFSELVLNTKFPDSLESFVDRYAGDVEMPFCTELLEFLHEINGE